MKASSFVSPHPLSSFFPLFFIMKVSNLLYFILVPTHTYLKCHMYENHASIRQQIRHNFCMAAIYFQWRNLITSTEGDIFIVSPTCHYH